MTTLLFNRRRGETKMNSHEQLQGNILYVDGVAVGTTFINQTNKTRWFSFLSGLDTGRIGCNNFQ